MTQRTTTFLPLALAVCLLGCPGEGPQPAPPGAAPGGRAPGAEIPSGSDERPDDSGAAPGAPDPDATTDSAPPEPASGLAKHMQGRAPVTDKTLEVWLTGLASRGDEGFVPEADVRDTLVLYLTESKATTGFCLQESVDPHRGGQQVSWSARPADGQAPDTLRATWEASGYAFTLTETVACLLLQAEPLATPAPPLDAAAVERLLQTAVQRESVDHEWVFELPRDADLTQGTHLISSRGAPAEALFMETRDDRADVLITGGRVWLVFFKKIAQRVGFDDEHTWFRDSTREALSKAAR